MGSLAGGLSVPPPSGLHAFLRCSGSRLWTESNAKRKTNEGTVSGVIHELFYMNCVAWVMSHDSCVSRQCFRFIGWRLYIYLDSKLQTISIYCTVLQCAVLIVVWYFRTCDYSVTLPNSNGTVLYHTLSECDYVCKRLSILFAIMSLSCLPVWIWFVWHRTCTGTRTVQCPVQYRTYMS